ncbi:MAG TPA: response regulator transcription factor [Draconibacterium sp.]|nr:response regulator transcription factor [Draconibacterium sp.]
MSKIRILATEDDTLHEEMLRITIEQLGYDLIDVIYKPSSLFLKIDATKPDILLMDIDLGDDVSGIDLVKEVNERYDIPVIYVTSFADSDTFQKAKKTYPAAYIVKPYTESELQRAIELAINNQQEKTNAADDLKKNVIFNNNIFVKEGKAFVKIETNSIKLIEAYDKYCFIYTSEKKSMIRSKLKDIYAQLPTSQFFQVHRSYIININAIDKIVPNSHKIISAGKEIPVSKLYRQNLFSRLNYVV